MKARQFIGLLILLLVAAFIVILPRLRTLGRRIVPVRPTEVTLSGKVGGEKIAYLRNPAVVRILKDRYGIVLQVQRAGSVELLTEPPAGQQFLWPANQMQVELYRRTGGVDKGVEGIFNSPIVIYSWRPVADALVATGVVKSENQILYIDDFAQLIRWIERGRKWKDIGLSQLYGRMSITATDPQHSNSGFTFAGMVASQ